MTRNTTTYTTYQKSLIRHLVYFQRNNLNYTYANVVSLMPINISITALNDFEKGKRFPSQQNLNLLFSILDISFDDSDATLQKAKEDFYIIIDKYYRDDNDLLDSINKFINNNRYKFSYGFPYYIFSLCLKSIITKPSKLDIYVLEILDDINKTNRELEILTTSIKYSYYYATEQFSLIPSLFNNDIDFYISPYSNLNDVSKGIISLYMMQKAFSLVNINPLQSLDEINNAINLLEYCNYRTLKYCALEVKAIILDHINDYKIADILHKQVINNLDIFPDSILSFIIFHINIHYCLSNQFNKIYELIDKYYDCIKNKNVYLCTIVSYLNDDKDNFNKYYALIQDTDSTIYIKHLYQIITLLKDSRKDKVNNLATQLLQQALQQDKLIYIILLHLIIKYYVNIGNLKKLTYYQSLLIQTYKN